MAAGRGHVKLAEFLLEKGAKVDLAGPVRGYGFTLCGHNNYTTKISPKMKQ